MRIIFHNISQFFVMLYNLFCEIAASKSNEKRLVFSVQNPSAMFPQMLLFSTLLFIWWTLLSFETNSYSSVEDPGGLWGIQLNPPLAHSLVWKIPIWKFTFAQKYLSGNLRTPARTPLHRILDPPQLQCNISLTVALPQKCVPHPLLCDGLNSIDLCILYRFVWYIQCSLVSLHSQLEKFETPNTTPSPMVYKY